MSAASPDAPAAYTLDIQAECEAPTELEVRRSCPSWLATLIVSPVEHSNINIQMVAVGPEGDGRCERQTNEEGQNHEYILPSKGDSMDNDTEIVTAVRSSDVFRAKFTELLDDAQLLRSIPVSTLLEGCGWWVRSGPILGGASKAVSQDEGERMFAKSSSVQSIAQFVSHSWHANSKMKAMSLLTHYNAKLACLVQVVAFITVAALMAADILPPWVANTDFTFWKRPHPFLPARGPFAGWFSLSTFLGYFSCLVFGQRLRSLVGNDKEASGVFLDKLCIHQTDECLKAKGIGSIGAFLLHSREMLLLWDSTYIE
eukprot:TRINITY_DN21083_c0_g1_i2.p1 TRINITY_DN21083_c0_g1~~TRINITY_DN21083_c0_g1_i2.p1  ORF type:complete len:338 (-),score=17.86 TRINITY_DN21083_c0_g1_i2:43-984(-)